MVKVIWWKAEIVAWLKKTICKSCLTFRSPFNNNNVEKSAFWFGRKSNLQLETDNKFINIGCSVMWQKLPKKIHQSFYDRVGLQVKKTHFLNPKYCFNTYERSKLYPLGDLIRRFTFICEHWKTLKKSTLFMIYFIPCWLFSYFWLQSGLNYLLWLLSLC